MSTQAITLSSPIVEGMSLLSIQNEKPTVSLTDEFLGPLNEVILENYIERKKAFVLAKGACVILSRAIERFLNGQLENFDGLVSDTACQIRAIIVAKAYLETMSQPRSIDELKKLQCDLNQLATLCNSLANDMDTLSRKQSYFAQERIIVGSLLKQEKVELRIPESVLQLGRLFMLHEVILYKKMVKPCSDASCKQEVVTFQEQTDANKLLCYFKNVQFDEISKLIEYSKLCISRFGANYLREIAQSVCPGVVSRMLKPSSARVIQNREELACFYSLKAVVKAALSYQIPIVLKVKKALHPVEADPKEPFDVKILYRPQNKQRFVINRPASEDKCAIVIEAIRAGAAIQAESTESYLARLKEHDIEYLCDLNAAQHRQYTREEEIPELEAGEKEKLASLVVQAKSLGCAYGNKLLLGITHIFCESMDTLLKQAPKFLLLHQGGV